jgi:uncharacterized protein HemY
MGKLLILLGIIIILVGVIVTYSDRIPFIGKLPGDITIEKENFKFYFPLTTSILISIVLSLVLYFINRWRQ